MEDRTPAETNLFKRFLCSVPLHQARAMAILYMAGLLLACLLGFATTTAFVSPLAARYEGALANARRACDSKSAVLRMSSEEGGAEKSFLPPR